MTDNDRIEMVEHQVEHIINLCESYVEADQLEDVGNIRALFEEYAEWIDTFLEVEGSDDTYETAWMQNWLTVD
tara:strand:- start:62 stop:280 length:219 start_codon:yes stop_codon:yes gene_type:complete